MLTRMPSSQRIVRSCALLGTILLLFSLISPTEADSTVHTIESEATPVTQSGNWATTTDPNASGGSYLLNSGNPADTLTLAFAGPYLEIVYVAAPWTGTMVIEIDGVERRTVNTNGDLAFGQSVVFQYLTDDAHTLTVSAVEGDLIAVDAFVTVPRTADEQPSGGPAMLMGPQAVEGIGETKLLASDGDAGDFYGIAVAIDGNRAIVGARDDDDNGTNSGAAYIYDRQPDATWTETKLTASDGAAGDFFGFSVSISGDRAIVGAYLDDDNGTDSGAAYIYDRQPNGTWAETKLTASDGDINDYFGSTVSVSGDRALVGASLDDDNGEDSGSAYIFERQPNGTWTQIKLLAGDGAAGDFFGYSVGISGKWAIVGALFDDDDGSESGSAYIFERQPNGVWSQVKLTATDGSAGDRYGHSVSIADDRAIVGAYWDDPKGNESGSAYLYERQPDGSWSQAKLSASDGSAGDRFGRVVSIAGDFALVGAYWDDDNGGDSGSAYLYERQSNGTWVQTKIVPSDGAANDFFGASVDIAGTRAIVGAVQDDDNGGNSGSAYVYDIFSIPINTNFLDNSDFSAGREPWVLFGDFQFALNNGVMEFYRTYPGWKAAQLFQNVDQEFPAGAALEASVELGNNSNVPKGVRLRLRSQNWTDVITCSVTIPPNTPLTTVTMRGITSLAWDNFNFGVSLYDNDDTAAVLVDNASVQFRPLAGITGLDCQGFPPNANTNLLQNGNFANGRFYWTLWGDFQFTLNNGVMEFYRQSGATRLANLFTEAATYIPTNRAIRLDVQIGNSSNVTKDISVIIRDSLWAQTFNCTFTVPPNTPLSTVRVQGITNQLWSNPFVMVRAMDADGQAAVLVDNAVVIYLPGLTAPTQCQGAFPFTED